MKTYHNLIKKLIYFHILYQFLNLEFLILMFLINELDEPPYVLTIHYLTKIHEFN